MRSADTFSMGLKALKERPLETGLIILGITLASCVAAASLLLLLSQRAQSEKILSGAAFREIVVSSASDPGASNARSGVTLIDQKATQNFSLDNSDMQAVTSSVPLVAYAYRAETTRFRAGNFGGPGGGPGGGNGGRATASTSSSPAPAASSASSDKKVVVINGDVVSGTPPPGGPDGPPGFQQETVPEGTVLIKPAADTFNGVSVNPQFFTAYRVSAAKGSLFTDDDAANNASTLVLGPNLAQTLFPDKTADQLIGQKTRLNGRIWTIVGILEKASSGLSLANGNSLADLAFGPIRQQGFVFDAGPGAVGFGGQSRTLRFAVAQVSDLTAASEALTKYFDAKYGEGKVSIRVPFDTAQLSQSGFERLLWIIVAFGVGTLVMALINLMNMMLTRALRRQSALGILSAMGANRQAIAALQAVEGGLMALGGTLLGVLLSLPLYGLLYQAGQKLFNLTTAQAPFDAAALLVVTPGLLALTLLLAFIPAWQSSKITITTALRSE